MRVLAVMAGGSGLDCGCGGGGPRGDGWGSGLASGPCPLVGQSPASAASASGGEIQALSVPHSLSLVTGDVRRGSSRLNSLFLGPKYRKVSLGKQPLCIVFRVPRSCAVFD